MTFFRKHAKNDLFIDLTSNVYFQNLIELNVNRNRTVNAKYSYNLSGKNFKSNSLTFMFQGF